MAESIYRKASLSMIPYGAKEDVLPSIKPTDGTGDFTFSRNADIEATRVNASGLIEKAKVNLLEQSNTFDTTWNVADGTLTSGQTGYDGSNDAWQLTTTSSAGSVFQLNTDSGVQTFSVYIKGDGSTGVRMYAFGSVNQYAYFNLNNGEVGGDFSIKAQIQDVGGGWYRCSIAVNQTNSQLRLYTTNAAATTNSAGTIFIQDAQLNYGLVAQDYVETTTTAVVEGLTADLPRLDYSGGASCPSLLLEPSRTNKFLFSEYFDGSYYVKGSGVSVVDNNYTSPEGVLNGAKLTGAIGTTRNSEVITRVMSVSSSTTYTASIYVYKDTATQCTLYLRDGSTGVVVSESVTLEEGWQRINKSITTGASTSQINWYLGNTDGDIGIYGAQLEAGSYPTSYIPTYGTAANRGSENVDLTSASAIIGQTEGVMFMEYDITNLESGYDWFGFNDNATTNRLILGVIDSSTQGYRLFVVSGGTTSIDTRFGNTTSGGVVKVAVKYDNGSYKVFVNGSEELSTTGVSSFASTLTDIDFNDGGTLNITEPVKQFLVFPTALTDAECIALTTI